MAESAITFLVHQISDWLHSGQKFIVGIEEEIVYIKDAFEQMRTFSRVADAKEEEDAELQVWIKKVLDLAHDVQDILESHFVMCNSFQEKVSWPWKKPHHSLMSEKLFEAQNDNILKASEGIKARIIVISEGHKTFLQKYGVITSAESSNITWCNNHEVLHDDADLVGIENHKSVLLEWVLSDDPEWKLLCVVGTRGIGKTTLVKKIFDDATVNKHFNHHTLWIDIPKFSNVKELFTSMLAPQDDHSRRALETMDANMLAQFLQLFFESSRYLIVLDDVPDIGTWRTLKCAFPRVSCGSRIIIISRFADICHTICVETDVDSHVYNLKPLSKKESWILFCRKAFSGSLLCPSSLMQISNDIVQKCRGLPLAILVIAGALATKGKRKEAWEIFYDSLVDKLQGSYSEVEHMKRILNLCYQDLPFYLKSCFTYLSIVPKYHIIDKMRLTRLWAAEGLVLEREGKAVAKVAESYLNELANRSLIQVDKKYPDGRLAIFSINNLWYEIILSKSGESAMATIANGEETRRPHKVRHLVITDELTNDIQNIDQFKHLHSLITFGSPDSVTSSFLLKLLCGSFKLLKVLDLTQAPLVKIPKEVFELVHLKFLNLKSTKIKHLPGSIQKLENLEFLDLRETSVNKLPVEILRLQHLRHVLIYRRGAGFLHGFIAPENIGILASLEVVTLINATTSTVIELGKLTRLRKLEIAKLRRKHARDLCSSLDKLINLEQLSISSYGVNDIIDLHYPLRSTHSSLRTLTFEGRLERLPIWVTSLEALATVHLTLTKLVDNALETLQDLPNLVNLVLDSAYEGEELRFRAGGFKKLRELYIWHCRNLSIIKVEEGAMPSLEELQLCNCPVMKEFPFGIEHLSKLQRLVLQNVSEKMLMTLQLEDSQSGDYWKIAHIPRVQIVDL
ncbi:disease resistance protein RPM1-like [Nicotiana tabacum]|uniref:disease resistance protein RPM1-like n=1 Tax=Nicotiana tabacum TaxID=4097 RepID=UPI003F4EAF3B